MSSATRARIVSILNRCAIFVCIGALLIALYLIAHNAGLIDGSFGPGSYYYSDIPGWEKIFLSDKTMHLGFGRPVLAYGFFVLWGIGAFKLLLWLDKKIK